MSAGPVRAGRGTPFKPDMVLIPFKKKAAIFNSFFPVSGFLPGINIG
jgi:hypothetical protein